MDHKHEPIAQLDGLVKCRTCGIILSNSEQELGRVSSARMAHKILVKIATEGEFVVGGYEDGFVIYKKDRRDGLKELITIRKEAERAYAIIQKLMTKA